MAYLIGPSEASRLVFNIVATNGVTKGLFKSKAGRPATYYVDPDPTAEPTSSMLTTLADVRKLDGTPYDDSTVTIDAYSMLPSMRFPEGTPAPDSLLVTCDGGPPVRVYAREDDRLDALATAVAAATSGSSAAVSAEATARAAADIAVAAAAATDATTKASAAQTAATTAAATDATTKASAAQAAAISAAATDATTKASAAQAAAIQRANHTGTQLYTTITGLGGAATLSVGKVAGTVAAGDDARLSASGLLVSEQAGANDLLKIQATVTAAAVFGAWAIINGSYSVSGTVNVPSGARIDFSQGSVTQVSVLTPTLLLDNVSNVRIRNPNIVGVGTDWVNTTSVYGASGIRMTGTTSDVRISGGSLLNLAGAGVFAGVGVSKFRINGVRMTGPGTPTLTPVTSQYGGNVVLFGNTDFSVIDCDLSLASQGIVTGEINDFRLLGNYVHDVVGQHGMYLEPGSKFTINGNEITRTGLQGIKLQIPTTGSPDADLGTIVGNSITFTGSHCILITNTAGGAPRSRRIVVADNVLTGDGSRLGDGVQGIYLDSIQISDNQMYNVRKGVNVLTSSRVRVFDNIIDACNEQGVSLTDVSDSRISRNRVINPAASNDASTEFGIEVQGSNTAGIIIDNNKVTDALGNMKYGLYLVAGIDQTTCEVYENTFTGATDYGARLDSTQTLTRWEKNACSGTIGDILGFPAALVVRGAPGQATGIAPPTTGGWARGETVWNRTPTTGGVQGWRCISAGTPGTWAAFGKAGSDWTVPADNGLMGASFDPILANTNMAAMTAGVLYLTKVDVPAGGPITNVQMLLGIAGATLTSGQNLVGVYVAAAGGALLGQTADQSTAWLSTGQKAPALVTPTAAQDAGTSVYVAVLWNGSTSPQLRGLIASAAFVNIGVASVPRYATAGSLLTALPATLPTLTASVIPYWIGIA